MTHAYAFFYLLKPTANRILTKDNKHLNNAKLIAVVTSLRARKLYQDTNIMQLLYILVNFVS